MITESFKLPVGLIYNDKKHTSVKMRASIIADTIEAEKSSDGKGLLILTLELMARQIVSFGEIPADKIDANLLAQLTDADFERMGEVREYLKKKAVWQSDD